MNLLTLIVALMPLFSYALVPPAIAKVQNDKQDLTIVYHKADSDVTVEVHSGGNLVGQSCSSSLSSGAFEKLPIIFDVNEDASGNLTVGSSTYLIHEDANYSGGIVCARMFNQAGAVATCTVAVPADISMQPLSKSNIAECISDHRNRLAKFLQVATNPPGGSANAGEADILVGPTDSPHQSNCGPEGTTKLFGDGDPHQNYYLLQLSGWIDAGFSVAVAWNTGFDYHCTGGPGDTVCVWYNIAHTAYTVRNAFKDLCTYKQSFSEPYVMSSPNKDNDGGQQYCVVGACRHKEANYWDRSGRAGGPDR